MKSYKNITTVLLDNIIVDIEKYVIQIMSEYNVNADNEYKINDTNILNNVFTNVYGVAFGSICSKQLTIMHPCGVKFVEDERLANSSMLADNVRFYSYSYELLDLINIYLPHRDTKISSLSRLNKQLHKALMLVDAKIENEYLKSKSLCKIDSAKSERLRKNNEISHVSRRAAVDSLTDFIVEDIQAPCACPHIQYENYLLSLAQTDGSAVNLNYKTQDGVKRLTQTGIHNVVKEVFDRVAPERKVGHAPVKVPCKKHGIE